MDNTGVLYGVFGRRHHERLCTSVYSLRKHYTGPVCIQGYDGPGDEIAKRIADCVPGIQHQSVRPRCPIITRDDGYAAKTEMVKYGPFARGVFLDCDTTVAGSFLDDLLPREDEQVVFASFAGWTPRSSRVAKRLARWEAITPSLYVAACHPILPAINTGVYGFRRDALFFQERWAEVAWLGLRGGAGFICDEIAAQIILPEIYPHSVNGPARIASERYNHSPQFPTHNGTDVRIWHYHGGKHLKAELGRATWLPLYREAWGQNIAGLQEWGTEYE